MGKPQRRKNRLQGYDYSRTGWYFITVCVKGHAEILGEIVTECRGAHCAPAYTKLSDIGHIVENAILQIPKHYKGARVDKYVIMPNHIHMILQLEGKDGRTMCASTCRPSIPGILRGMKEAVTKTVGFPLWQKSFHDHIIRGEADYLRIWHYIDTNPAKWREDCYYKDGDLECPRTIKPT